MYTYCGNNPILFVDPSGNKLIEARAWLESKGATVTWIGNRAEHGTVYAYAKISYTFKDYLNGKVHEVSVNLSSKLINNKMMVDEAILIK